MRKRKIQRNPWQTVGPVWMTALFAREKANRWMVAGGIILSSQRSGHALSSANNYLAAHSFWLQSNSLSISGTPFIQRISPDLFWLLSPNRSLDLHFVTADSFRNEMRWKKKERVWVREREMVAFLPVPKKGTHRHIFAIVHNRERKL